MDSKIWSADLVQMSKRPVNGILTGVEDSGDYSYS